MAFGLIDKTPPNSQPDHQPWIRISGCGQVVTGKPKASPLRYLHRVEIFGSQEGLETPYPDMNKGGDVRRIGNSNAVLVKKLPQYRRVIIRLVRSVILQLKAC